MERLRAAQQQTLIHEFFKVFWPETSSTQLRLPKAFNDFFNGTTPSKTTLVDHDGKSWEMYLEKLEDRLILKDGWEQFVKDKCLEEADFLFFEYTASGKSEEFFYARKIFSRTGIKKETAICGNDNIVILDEDSDSDQICERRLHCGQKRKHSETLHPRTNEKKPNLRETWSKSKIEYEKNAQQRPGAKTLPEEFFQIFLPETRSIQLRLPRAFNKFFNGTTPSKATLMDHEKNCWDMDLEKIEDRLILKNGWQQLVKDKCLEEADLLIFQYNGKSEFYVKQIFSRNGCKRETTNCPNPIPIIILDDDSHQRCEEKPCGHKRKHSATCLKINEKPNSEGPSMGARSKLKTTYEDNGDYYVNKASGSAPWENFHFNRHIGHYQMRVKKLEVPRRALKKWNIKLTSQLTLKDENGNSWRVKVITNDQDRILLADGWSDFMESKNVNIGHTCDFKFVMDKTNVVAEEVLVRVHPPSN